MAIMNSAQHRNWISTRLRAASAASALVVVLVLGLVTIQSAQAQTFTETVLYSFIGGNDGKYPEAGVIQDAKGNLYGTTSYGGASCYCGTVFVLDTHGTETLLHSFAGGTDGVDPYAGLLMDAKRNLYGTTVLGGTSGYGTVFKLTKAGKETVLYTFTGLDGENPYGGLIRDLVGNLYGTTSNGGASGYGAVFKLSKSGKESVLHDFTGYPTDGEYSYAGLVRDAAGNLYGTTYRGGTSDYGTVFKLGKTGKEKVLYSFTGADGSLPYSGLLMDAKGNLYGTTSEGGTSGYGAVFKLTKAGKETVLYSFCPEGYPCTDDGASPYAGLVMDAKGNFYGTTGSGGTSGYGTVFKLSKSGKESVLYSFTGLDGENPYLGFLLMDAKGNLYGTTSYGGSDGYGTVWKLTP
jgi:uncharacterized repeat protein (TIGR03803 family)